MLCHLVIFCVMLRYVILFCVDIHYAYIILWCVYYFMLLYVVLFSIFWTNIRYCISLCDMLRLFVCIIGFNKTYLNKPGVLNHHYSGSYIDWSILLVVITWNLNSYTNKATFNNNKKQQKSTRQYTRGTMTIVLKYWT